MRRLALASVLAVAGCANAAAVYTEAGIRAGAGAWDTAYREKAGDCESKFEPATPAMEECFGAFFDANEKVGAAIEASVAILRTYWTARAAGDKPDLGVLVEQLGEIIEELPPEAKTYFDRVKGLKP